MCNITIIFVDKVVTKLETHIRDCRQNMVSAVFRLRVWWGCSAELQYRSHFKSLGIALHWPARYCRADGNDNHGFSFIS